MPALRNDALFFKLHWFSECWRVCAQHHIANPFGEVRGLCQCAEVDVVSVVSPTYLHCEQMIGEPPMPPLQPHTVPQRCGSA